MNYSLSANRKSNCKQLPPTAVSPHCDSLWYAAVRGSCLQTPFLFADKLDFLTWVTDLGNLSDKLANELRQYGYQTGFYLVRALR